jgi:hypothetical protein
MNCIFKVAMGFCLLLEQCKCKPRPSPANPNPQIEANPFKYIL